MEARLVTATRELGRRLRQRFAPRGPKLREMRKLMPSSLFAADSVPPGKPELPAGRLATVWSTSGPSHKWFSYFAAYEKELSPYIGAAVRILEIGVLGGGSLEMWKTYLGEHSIVVGIDIDPDCAKFDRPGANVHVRIGSQVDGDFLHSVVAEFGPFDIIIDDGSHMLSHVMQSFGHLFDTALRPGGVYIIEDMHALYAGSFADVPYSVRRFAGDLADLVNVFYWNDAHAFVGASSPPSAPLSVPHIAAIIDSVTIRDSMFVIHRRREPASLPFGLRNTELEAVAGNDGPGQV